MIQMTYQKRNGGIIQRTISGISPYRVGDTNSYGWTVVSIKHLYKGKWYSINEYDKLVGDEIAKMKRKNKIRFTITNLYKNLGYLIELTIALRVFQIISNVGM